MASLPITDSIIQALQREKEAFWSGYPRLTDRQKWDLWKQRTAGLASILGTETGPRQEAQGAQDSRTMARRVSMMNAGRSKSARSVTLNQPPDLTPSSCPASIPLSEAGSASSKRRTDANEENVHQHVPKYRRTSQGSTGSVLASVDERLGPCSVDTVSDARGTGFRSHVVPEVSEFHAFAISADCIGTLPDAVNEPSSISLTSPKPGASLPGAGQQALTLQFSSSFGQESFAKDFEQNKLYTRKIGELTIRSSNFSEISRNSSVASNSFSDTFDMLKIQSSRSDLHGCSSLADKSWVDALPLSWESVTLIPPAIEAQDCRPPNLASFTYCVGQDLNASYPFSFVSAPLAPSEQTPQPYSSVSNDKIESRCTESGVSPISLSSNLCRWENRQQTQTAQATGPIAPKVADGKMRIKLHDEPHHEMVRIPLGDGFPNNVAAIAKTPYVRPSQPKLMCQHCNDYPEGFRGDHELQRHYNRIHSNVRKVWVCVDISPDGQFLADCKNCRNGKEYGASYNAAAHLRRAHFSSTKKGTKAKGENKRAAKGGGNSPSMEVLKHWMKEVEERGSDDTEIECGMDNDEDHVVLADDSVPNAIAFDASHSCLPHTATNNQMPAVSMLRYRYQPHDSSYLLGSFSAFDGCSQAGSNELEFSFDLAFMQSNDDTFFN